MGRDEVWGMRDERRDRNLPLSVVGLSVKSSSGLFRAKITTEIGVKQRGGLGQPVLP